MRLPYKSTVYVWLGNFVPAVNSEAQSYGDQDWTSELEMPDIHPSRHPVEPTAR